MKTGKRFSPEIRGRSVRMVFDQEREYSSLRACIEPIAGKVGCSSQTLKNWVAIDDVDQEGAVEISVRIDALFVFHGV